MAKPRTGSSGNSPSSSVAPKSSFPNSTIHDSESELLRLAQKAQAAGIEPRHDARAAARSARTIISLRTMSPEQLAALGDNERKFAIQVRGDLDAAGIDISFIAPGQALVNRFEALLDGSPSDRRKIGVVSPEDKEKTVKAAKRVARAKNAVASAARSRFQTEAAEAFGRGMTFVHENPVDVGDAIRQFLAGAEKYPELVEVVGITEKDLAQLESDRKEMDAILQRKQLREGSKATGTDAIKLEQLALESWLDLYRGRINWRLEDEAARERTLGLLPRAPDRRKRATTQPTVVVDNSDTAQPVPAPPVVKTAVE